MYYMYFIIESFILIGVNRNINRFNTINHITYGIVNLICGWWAHLARNMAVIKLSHRFYSFDQGNCAYFIDTDGLPNQDCCVAIHAISHKINLWNSTLFNFITTCKPYWL
jgi:hypothetical protein